MASATGGPIIAAMSVPREDRPGCGAAGAVPVDLDPRLRSPEVDAGLGVCATVPSA